MRFICLLCAVLFSYPVYADYGASKRWFYERTEEGRLLSQYLLIFSGDYIAIVDGSFGPRTYQALLAFQKRNGFFPDGVLTDREIDRLVDEAVQVIDRQGFRFVTDAETLLELGMPTALLTTRQRTEYGTRWSNGQGSIEIETLSIPVHQVPFKSLYSHLSSSNKTRDVTYKVLRNRYFVVSGFVEGRGFYLRMERGPSSTKGFYLSWIPDGSKRYERIAVAMSNSLRISPRALDELLRKPQNDDHQPNSSKPDVPEVRAGSGFFVSGRGHVATNAHVVDGCSIVEIVGRGAASVLRTDQRTDLALLQTYDGLAPDYARFRQRPIRRGEFVFAMGYPLSTMLANNLTITQGIVSSLAGYGGDISNFQISAAVQPGNSGGPVIDRFGTAIGVVTSRLDDEAAMAQTGAIPQNVNFAIRNTLVTAFMINAGIEPEYTTNTLELGSEQVADVADDYTVQIVCRPGMQEALARERAARKAASANGSKQPISDEEFLRQLEEAVRNAGN